MVWGEEHKLRIGQLGPKGTSSSLNLPALQIFSKSSPPAAYSITMARCVGVKQTCYPLIRRTNDEFVMQFGHKMINFSMFENDSARLILQNKLGCL